MRVLLTGATGFLGQALLAQLLERGHQVRVLARDPDRLPAVLAERVQLVQGDLLDLGGHQQLCRTMEAICHLGGLAHTWAAREAYDAVNVRATAQICRLARQSGVERVLLISSVSVYTVPAVGGGPQPCPPSFYAQSKWAAEQAAAELLGGPGPSLVILRLAPLVGPGGGGNLARLIAAIAAGRFLMIGDGRNQKTMLQRDDAAAAIAGALLAPAAGSPLTFDVADRPRPMIELIAAIAAAARRPLPRMRVPSFLAKAGIPWLAVAPGPGQRWAHLLERWLAEETYNCQSFRRWAGWQPRVGVDAGLREQVAWQLGATGGAPARSGQ